MQNDDTEKFLKKAFDLFDYERNETVNPKILASSFIEWKYADKYPFVFQLVCNLDQENMQGGISFDQFKGVILDSLGDRNSEEGVHKIFNILDLKRNESLDKHDLREMFQAANINASEEEVQKMVELLASDRESISRQDFIRLQRTLYGLPKP